MPNAATAIIIGQPQTCLRLEEQLDLMDSRPVSVGWIIAGESTSPLDTSDRGPILGTLDQLESIIARRRPSMALIALPAVMKDLITTTRTRLRKLGVADRFMPTLEDQVAGVGPRCRT